MELGRTGESRVEKIYRVLPVYRFCLIISLAMLACAVCIIYFRRFRVNYVFIFGIDPKYKLNQFQFFKIFLFMFFLWTTAALFGLLEVRRYTDIFRNGETAGWALILTASYALLLLMPFKKFYSSFRLELLFTAFQTLIAPFGTVRFKDFFFGDVLTSLVKPLVDVAFISCFFSSDSWLDSSLAGIC